MTDDNRTVKQNTSKNRRQGSPGFIASAKWWWVILILAVIALTVLVVLLASRRTAVAGGGNKGLSTFTARRDDLTVTVTESGSIKARKTIDIKSEVERQATIISIVPEGTYITQEDVNSGKVLVQLDSSALDEELTQREIDFAGAEASYAEAIEANDIQVKQNESDITAAELKVKFALMDFRKYLGETVAEKLVKDANPDPNLNIDIALLLDQLGGSASQELKKLKDDIILANAKFKRASNKLDWTRKLREEEYVSQTELEGDLLDANSFKIQKERAEIALELFRLYEFPKEAEKLLSDYDEAKRELERTYASARSKLAQAQARLKSAESRYRSRKTRLNKTRKQIEVCTIIAPAPGLVIYGSSGDPYRRMRHGPIEEGGTVYQRQTIISLPDTTKMMAEIGVHESSVTKVHPGQGAKIVMDAFPDEMFHGEVVKVAPLPDQQRSWLSPDLKVYTAEVSIEGSHDFLKPGMSAKVEILVEQVEDVIIVPVQVVANRGGKKVCYCLTSEGIEEREVQTGSFNDTFVQIIDGLEVGEEVLLSPPRLIESRHAGTGEQRQKPLQSRVRQSKSGISE